MPDSARISTGAGHPEPPAARGIRTLSCGGHLPPPAPNERGI